MNYRKRIGKDTWHFCKNCSNWPTKFYDEKNEKPRRGSGEYCDQCRAKRRNDNCKS